MTKTNERIDYNKSLAAMIAEPFQPDYNHDQLGHVYGYSKCLQDLLRYLNIVTEFKPEKRFVDSVPILDGITKAGDKLKDILRNADPDDIPPGLFNQTQPQ